MINTITKEEYPEIWDDIIEDHKDCTEMEHRRNSNFYTNLIYVIDEDVCPNNPELYGHWMSDVVIWNAENGCDDIINNLYRCEQKEVVKTTKEWTMI